MFRYVRLEQELESSCLNKNHDFNFEQFDFEYPLEHNANPLSVNVFERFEGSHRQETPFISFNALHNS